MTNNLPAVIAGKKLVVLLPERIVELNDRFENVSNIADAADKLMAIDDLRKDISAFYNERYALSSEERVVGIAGFGTLGAATLSGIVAGAMSATGWVAMIGLGLVCGVVGAVAGAMLAIGAVAATENLYERKSGDQRFAGDLSERVKKLEAETLKTLDTRKIALSEHAETIFDRYPDLSAKFARAQAIDKVRAEESALKQIPSLDKPKPEL